MKYAASLLAISLMACSREPRDARWFEAHPTEAKKVAKACAAGARTNECENARTGLRQINAHTRMKRYRQGFE